MTEYPASLQAEHLMGHMRVLCEDIGPRPATSIQERQAADYVERQLRQSGLSDIQRQSFASPNSLGWITLPCLMTGALTPFIARAAGQLGKLVSSALLVGSAYIFRQYVLVRPPFFQRWIARGTSQNVIARLPAAERARQTIYLVGHLDSQKQRFQFPPPQPKIMRAEASLPIVLGMLGGAWLLTDVLRGRQGVPGWLWLLSAAYAWGVSGALYDERQPHVEGANDNASAVSILLGMAQALQAQPLRHTDVILLFTGCEEVGCVGMEHYLRQLAPSLEDTFWIDLEMVGSGHVCYVTRHGITYLTPYSPHPHMVEWAEQVARQQPHLGVSGKDMLILEEIANLRRRGYQAICVAGYDEEGFLPDWHRLSDNLDHIEPDTLSRAACYTWELMHAIDRRDDLSSRQAGASRK